MKMVDSFLQVDSNKPYGEDFIKNECVCHVQTPVGSVKKLHDGKPFTGKNRPTLSTMDTSQKYCGIAIRENAHILMDIVNVVLAVLNHVPSTDENLSMCFVGENSRCGRQKRFDKIQT